MLKIIFNFSSLIFFVSLSSGQNSMNFTLDNTSLLFEIFELEDDNTQANFTITREAESQPIFEFHNLKGSLNTTKFQKVYIKYGEYYVLSNTNAPDTLVSSFVDPSYTVKSFFDGQVLVYEHIDLSDSFKINQVTTVETIDKFVSTSQTSFDKNVSEEEFSIMFNQSIKKLLPKEIKNESVDQTEDQALIDNIALKLWYLSKNFFNKKEYENSLKAMENEKLEEAGVLELIPGKFKVELQNYNCKSRCLKEGYKKCIKYCKRSNENQNAYKIFIANKKSTDRASTSGSSSEEQFDNGGDSEQEADTLSTTGKEDDISSTDSEANNSVSDDKAKVGAESATQGGVISASDIENGEDTNVSDNSSILFEATEVEASINKNQMGITVYGNAFLDDSVYHVIIEFNKWDFYLNNDGFARQKESFSIEGETYEFNVGQILRYVGPKDGKAILNVKNSRFRLTKNDPKEVLYKRAFTDFVSGVIFTDLLSSRVQKPNKFLQTEVMLNFPLSHSNTRKKIFVNEIVGAISYSPVSDDVSQLDLVKDNNLTYSADFIEFVKFNNIQTRFRLNILKVQNKKIQGNHYFDFGFDMFSTNVRYFNGIERVGRDTIVDYSSFLISKVAPQVTYRFEAFPTDKVGVFFDVGYSLFFKQKKGFTDGIEYDITFPSRIKYRENHPPEIRDRQQAHLFTYSLNALYLFNPEKGAAGGIFSRLRIYQNAIASEFYPQILVGYGININSLMK